MKKATPTFEQVPVSVARKIARAEETPSSNFVSCVLCGHAVELEKCKVDENGGAVHEKCYLTRMSRGTSFRSRSAAIKPASL